jgi:hypothetical protein
VAVQNWPPYGWLSTWGLDGVVRRAQPVGQVRLGTHDGFVVINGRVKCTPEHPILVRRDDQWGFVSAEFVEVGDALFLNVAQIGQPHSSGRWGGLRGRSRRLDAVCRPVSLDFGLISVDLARSMDAFAHATA